MNKEFFDGLDGRAKEFGESIGIGADVRVELWMTNGRGFVIKRVGEATDAWIRFDAWDIGEGEQLSLSLPYHQIGHVLMMKPKTKAREAGFKLELG
jgi:hypothetical protein